MIAVFEVVRVQRFLPRHDLVGCIKIRLHDLKSATAVFPVCHAYTGVSNSHAIRISAGVNAAGDGSGAGRGRFSVLVP